MTILQFWGKTQPIDTDKTIYSYHFLPYHCLDVAAVGHVWLKNQIHFAHDCAKRLNIEVETFIAWQTFLLALHDIGKFSERFQGLCPTVQQQLQRRVSNKRYSQRHDSMGFLLLQKALFKDFLQRKDMVFIEVEDCEDWQESVFSTWLATVCGHHGQPPALEGNIDHFFSDSDLVAAEDFFNQCVDLLLPETVRHTALDLDIFEEQLPKLSWWLAGWAVLSDWVGSNTDYFPYCSALLSLQEYWDKHALPNADKAIQDAGLLPITAANNDPLQVFSYIQQPTPLQAFAYQLPLPKAPQLFILEDVTGAGKTEAALILLQKLLQNQQAHGVYIGLPTMATANAMYQRVGEVATQFYAANAQPTVVLAHSASRLAEYQRQQALTTQFQAESSYDRADDETATAMRSTWVTDSRKKALLADVGVGTLDQALLAVLPVRHQVLRLLGLHGKVLICDEVHACDVYMLGLLKALLTFQAYSGNSVILLSATLPQQMRQELVNAYCQGLGVVPPSLTSQDYPLLTHIHTEVEQIEHPLATRREVQRQVEVKLHHDVADVVTLLQTVQQQARCACWIRNTVSDAVEAYQMLLDAGVPLEKLDLFHARFALGDRLETEKRVLGYFDADSGHDERAGRILIATQVVEQSLDLDFDVLISDLAPIDLLIQRAGRLCRHVRDANGERLQAIDAQDQRGTPVLHVLSPSLEAEPQADWYSDLLPKAAGVYRDVGKLWLTAQLLVRHSGFVMPDDARDLIEGVYGMDVENEVPEVFAEQQSLFEGKQLSKGSLSQHNKNKLATGYAPCDVIFWNDVYTPTRADADSVTVRLARWQNGQLQPWSDDAHERFAWELSQVNMLESAFNDEVELTEPALQAAVVQYKENVFDQGKWSKLLVLQEKEKGLWFGEGMKKGGKRVEFCYDEVLGLRENV